MLRSYQQFSRDYVLYELPMVEGWAWYAWAMENDGWLNFNCVTRSSRGYLGHEVDDLIRIAKEHYAKMESR